MKAFFFGLKAWWGSENRLRRFLTAIWGPVMSVGNFDRVRKPGECDPDEERLGDLNKLWRAMLREDSGMVRLMRHVSLLMNIVGLLFLVFFFSGLFLPVKHWIFTAVLIGNAATIPYWFWVGGWYNKIVKRVFEAFKKKYGKHFHLK